MNTYTQNITDTPPTSDTLDTPCTPSLSEASSTPEKLSGEAAWNYGDTFELISKVAYLIGVPRRIFENENEPPKMEVFRRLELDKAARIIRHLCILRTAIERNFKAINEAMRMDFRTLYSMPELVPSESLRQLSEDGASFVKRSSTKLGHHVIEINRLISDRINNCRNLFPIWVNWQYIKELFLMPGGLSEEGTKEAAEVYYANRKAYPYQMYINWNPANVGNILYTDKKFAQLLYSWHDDVFEELSKASYSRAEQVLALLGKIIR